MFATGMASKLNRTDAFDLPSGRVIAGKYRIEDFLGSGWEGEVYRVSEVSTGLPRAAKLFYPQRNVKDRAVRMHARKLDRLRKCPIVIQYHHLETLRHRGTRIACLVSELVEGELLEKLVARQRGKRLHPFEALHLLHVLAGGVAQIHHLGEYHGDIHDRNVLVERKGIRFEVKLLDFYHWGRTDRTRMKEDVVDLVRLLYEAVGGRRRYAAQPPEVKSICRGLRRDLIMRRFPTADHLRGHLESFSWDSASRT
jgi:tRNA A-37 threonylcarbamoyl transferase component Bud32